MTTEERIAKIRKGIPEHLVRFYDSAMKGKSRKMAIRAKCLDCCAWDRTESAKCPAVECPLYPYNPFLGCAGRIKRNAGDETGETGTTGGVNTPTV